MRQRDRMAAELGRFYAALHAIPLDEAEAAGALRIPDWPGAEAVLPTRMPMLPEALHAWIAPRPRGLRGAAARR